ncbi:target of rapamycin complex 2 subunit MAPKAP1 isoform X3 [Phocoena sinus]|uniref:target of rapamycin complex 2 subunit MAPKAP1 isoform X3 n=1 Tax=Phocoena sinus TaxID=42100 RepID=UPI0013C4E82A|nr:target of rapamycin complex 2 subunit MAPKAP1 isoform X3 [Phocoena sinus]
MAFLDNPTIILAHIRQSHVTSDDTGMCEMVLIDHDVDLEKIHPPSMPGDSGSEIQGSNGETQGYVYAQSVDITSSWDFGIRRRSNTAQRLERLRKERQNQIKCKNIQWKERNSKQSAQELKSLFEKKSLKEKPPHSGKQSILSVRLEQCPLQLNNPFNEYSKFDGKGHVGTTATKKIDVYLPLHSSQDRLLPMTVVTMASARVQDLIGLICWQYTSEGREPKLNDNVSAYCLHIAEDDGEVDTDFPPLDSNEPIHKFGFSTLALVEKYSSPGLTSKESLFVRINAAHGFSLIQVDNTKVTMKEILLKAVKRRKGSQKISGLSLLWPLLLQSTGSGRAGSAAMAHGPSRSTACGIFPDRGTNLCPLHRQADSQPLRHQGSPRPIFLSPFLNVSFKSLSPAFHFITDLLDIWNLLALAESPHDLRKL